MSKAEKLQTQPVGPEDLRRRASVLRAFSNHFDLVANMMDNASIPPLDMKGGATYDRAIGYLKGSVSTATQAVMDFVLEKGIALDVVDQSGTAKTLAELDKPSRKRNR